MSESEHLYSHVFSYNVQDLTWIIIVPVHVYIYIYIYNDVETHLYKVTSWKSIIM